MKETTLTSLKPIGLVKYFYNQYKDVNEKVCYLNNGGCGVFALKLYNLLLKLNLTPKLIVITDNIEGMKERIKTDKYGATLFHIMVVINKKYIDSTGVYSKIKEIPHSYNDKPCVELPISVLEKWVSNEHMWNNDFNRSDIKVIDKILIKSFRKVKKNLVN